MDSKTLKNVYKRLNTKTKLESHKLKLAAIDDVRVKGETAAGFVEDLELLDERIINDGDTFEAELDDVKILATEFETNFAVFEQTLGELGAQIDSMQQAADDFANLANELGFDPTQTEDYNILVNNLEDAKYYLEKTTVDDYYRLYELSQELKY